MKLESLLNMTVQEGASDLHITVGIPPVIRKDGKLVRIGEENITPTDTEQYVKHIIGEENMRVFDNKGELDVSYSIPGIGRFRVNVFKQRGTFGIAFRMVNLHIPEMATLGLPEVVHEISKKTKGLILVTGPTGNGKSTTLAAMINQINEQRECHILTIEEPIEYLHKHKNSIVNQREIGSDSFSYSAALKAALREDPDVILLGEMRDLETISVALTAAETGHLVLSTVHTVGAVNTIDRLVDVFPPHQQQQIRIQMSMVLQGIISQQLITKKDRTGRVLALEIMTATPAVRNLIRDGKTSQINTLIHSGAKYGMQSMDYNLVNLYKKDLISHEDAMTYAVDQDYIVRLMGN
ncbi:MAG: type IV pilus twitching motility protein PilT [Clostridia bacterium]|nr:type IV pilus twitching motility protein PilT [Clostridia bacterium]